MTYDSTRGKASLRHEINNSLTLISSQASAACSPIRFLERRFRLH